MRSAHEARQRLNELIEERANPQGYNQYKHMSGSTSPSAKKAAAASATGSAGAAYTPTQEAQELRDDYMVNELADGKLEVDLDVDDAAGAKRLARKHGAQVKIVEEGGPGGANPVARFTGEPKKVDALLKAYDGGDENAGVASHNARDY